MTPSGSDKNVKHGLPRENVKLEQQNPFVHALAMHVPIKRTSEPVKREKFIGEEEGCEMGDSYRLCSRIGKKDGRTAINFIG